MNGAINYIKRNYVAMLIGAIAFYYAGKYNLFNRLTAGFKASANGDA